jgi:hypothetical protein
MGSDAAVYVFDYAHYMAELVPAAKQLLLTGQMAPWWEQAVRGVAAAYGMASATDDWLAALANRWDIDLPQYCTYLSSDLGLLASSSDPARMARAGDQRQTWEARACPSPDCPIRQRCIFHCTYVTEREQPVEDFNQAFAYAIAARYVGEGQFVGRSYSPFGYLGYLADIGVDARDPLHELVERLGRRGFVVGYLFSNDDGIRGWLTPVETQDLHHRLDALPLPQYEATFTAMAEQCRAERIRRGQRPPAPGVDLDRDWKALSLSFVRTVAAIAGSVGQGVLWGNDLPTASRMSLGGHSS